MIQVTVAQPEDIPAWFVLAAEVEPLFGPMVAEPSFHSALHKNIERGTAFCVRTADGPPGAPLRGGLLFSSRPPVYTIGWLAVAQQYRRTGIGKKLVEHVLGFVKPPAELIVTTFGPDQPGGEAARLFYESIGFQAVEPEPDGPEGGSRQIFQRTL